MNFRMIVYAAITSASSWLMYYMVVPDEWHFLFGFISGAFIVAFSPAFKIKKCPHGYTHWDDCPDCRH